jgi:phosphopantothenoylcysteine decarboxylase/phosphopantothenate--cysteine ligase
MMLQNKTVLLGAGDGPLTWVAVEVLRELQRAGAKVHVVLGSATETFVPALTFQTLAGAPVLMPQDLYGTVVGSQFRPLATVLASVDAVVVVPATPALLAKLAMAGADEALVRAVLLHTGPTLLAYPGQARPYRHTLVQHHVQRLAEAGMIIFDQADRAQEDAVDELGWTLSAQTLVGALIQHVHVKTDFAGRVVIITAGPTQEPIDPVRHISNRSSGKTGFALAAAAQQRGAKVILVSGPTHLPVPPGVTCLRVQTALEMRQAVLDHFDTADLIIKTAAVADFRPQYTAPGKVKKHDAELNIRLERNPDILAELGQRKTKQVLVGFAAETENMLANARQKVQGKRLDFIVVNDVSDPAIGFASDDNRVHILDADGHVEALPTMRKEALADRLLDRVQSVVAQRAGGVA